MTQVSTNGGSSAREPTRLGFASPGRVRDELTALALGAVKVVTTGLLAEYEIDGDPVEQPGDISILVDSEERPVALIEDVLSKVIRLADFEQQDAIDEGEGYATVADFRATHERFWNESIDDLRRGLGDPAFEITDDTMVVAERFRIVGLLDADGQPVEPAVRPAYPIDRVAVDAFLTANNADLVARGHEPVDARRHPALIAETGGVVDGVLTWILADGSMEVLTLHARRQWAGIGTALVAAARRVAQASGAHRLWVVTTNDNVDALRFYQRRGFRLEAVAPGAVDATRAGLKPMIPEIGAHGIPLRDELTLEVTIGDAPAATASDREALLALELALARRDEASIPGGYDAVLANDFTEVGASGRRWTRDDLIAVLRSEPPNPLVSIVAFDAAEIGPGILLVTYDALGSRSEGGPIDSRRSSIWRRADGRWQLRFNQGTPLPPG